MAASAEPLTLKGLAPGMTVQQLEAAHPGFAARCAEWKRAPFGVHCDYSPSSRAGRPQIPTLDTLAGAAVDLWLVSVRNAEITTVSVGLSTRHYDRVVAALRERFGNPTKTEVGQTQNRMGATFDQEELTWSIDRRVLVAKKRSGKIDTMGLYLTSEAKLAEDKELRKQQGKTDSGDL